MQRPLQNGQFGSKIKNGKNMQKNILREHYSCFVQKTARKNTKYSRIEAILNIGHLAKAIAFARGPIFKIVSFLEYLVFFRTVFYTEQL